MIHSLNNSGHLEGEVTNMGNQLELVLIEVRENSIKN